MMERLYKVVHIQILRLCAFEKRDPRWLLSAVSSISLVLARFYFFLNYDVRTVLQRTAFVVLVWWSPPGIQVTKESRYKLLLFVGYAGTDNP